MLRPRVSTPGLALYFPGLPEMVWVRGSREDWMMRQYPRGIPGRKWWHPVPYRTLQSFVTLTHYDYNRNCSDTIPQYLGITRDTPFVRRLARGLNMVLYFCIIGNLDDFRYLAGEIINTARVEGVDIRTLMGGEERWTRIKHFVGSTARYPASAGTEPSVPGSTLVSAFKFGLVKTPSH